jgi:hypothetical protein
VYVSALVKSHIRIVASVEPVATILSSIWRQRTEAKSEMRKEIGTIVAFKHALTSAGG